MFVERQQLHWSTVYTTMCHKAVAFIVFFVNVEGCYWNNYFAYGFFGSKTPYDFIRGDIRDYPAPANCEAISLWMMSRHGNRYPSHSVAMRMKAVVELMKEILASYDNGTSKLCFQDIENLREWSWNTALDKSFNLLTNTGYDEMFKLGKRLRQKYGHLLQGTSDKFYFRPTHLQRSVTSCMAFIEGLTDGLHLNVTVDDPWPRDYVTKPFEKCDRYQKEVREGPALSQQLQVYFLTPEFRVVQTEVQKRIGISTNLTARNVFSMYDICRFYRSWTKNLRDPWCALFTDEELMILEYYDDVKHYYRNGYGASVNIELGKAPLKDLYVKFQSVINGGGKKVVSYFTHDAVLEMAWCALGLHADKYRLISMIRSPDRQWRTSFFAAFAANMVAVLYKCNENDKEANYRVQMFINEKIIPVCPLKGCTWKEFLDIFLNYTKSNMNICNMG